MRKLQRVTWATWGDRERDILHLDVAEMLECYDGQPGKAPTPRAAARCALRELRRYGIPGVIVAHVAGMARYGVQR